MIDKKLKGKYLLAIYLVVAGLAIICLLIGLRYTEGVVQGILLNLCASLFCVVLIFFLVDRVFLVKEWDTSERLDQLLSHLESVKSPSAEDFFQSTPSLDTYIQASKQIDWCGVTMEEEIHTHLIRLRDCLKGGMNLRILIADPKSDALEMSALRSEGVDNKRYEQKLAATLEDMKYLSNYLMNCRNNTDTRVGTFAVRLLPYAPSFGLFNFDGKTPEGVAFIEIFGHADGFGSFPSFQVTPKRDGKWYTFFIKQFEEMWETASPWQP